MFNSRGIHMIMQAVCYMIVLDFVSVQSRRRAVRVGAGYQNTAVCSLATRGQSLMV